MNILITGTSTGLGNGLTKHYLKQGHTVYGISRKADDSLNKLNNFEFLSQDLIKFDEVKEKISGFLKNVQSLDLVILNAGKLNKIKDLKETSLDEIKTIMDINLWANKILIDALTAQVRDIKHIVAISSGAAVSGARGWNAYSISKAALNMLIDLYAKELSNIHFTALAPGLIDTNMQDYIYNYADDEKFTVVKKLKKAKGTDQMPKTDEAARIISEAIQKSIKYASGSFLDVHNL
ncbi:MAG TPA: alcohol dehydrogenase [Bacteroidales bacterium]|nr:alcohol dehydrogenase [Bacteroidales bacterium]